MSSTKDKKIMNEVKEIMRLKHYSIHTERNYCNWIKKYNLFHRMTSRLDLDPGERKIEEFLTDLAVKKVSPATQNVAMNALVFLYKKVFRLPLGDAIDAVKAKSKLSIPVVCTRDQVRQIIGRMDGVPQLIVKLMYGCGLRVLESVRLGFRISIMI